MESLTHDVSYLFAKNSGTTRSAQSELAIFRAGIYTGSRMNTADETYPMKRALVIANDHSSNADRMHRQINALKLPVKIVHTSRDERVTRDRVYKEAQKGDVILGAGGDGTTHQIASIILSPEGQSHGLHLLPFVPLRGGNANDIASMINGRKTASQILAHGKLVELYPLEVQVRGREKYDRLVLGYVGLGGNAAVTLKYESLKKSATKFTRLTGLQLMREVVATWTTLTGYEQFELRHEGGKYESMVSYLVVRGDRLAKLGRSHTNLKRTEFEAITTHSSKPGSTINTLLRLQQGKLPGKLHPAKKFTIRTTDGDDLPVQYDGEYTQVASDSEFTVKISKVPYWTISTRL